MSDWRAVLEGSPARGASDEGIWGALLGEFEWLYRQMNRALRERFAPVFVLFELKTIVLCVRNKAARRSAEIERLLEPSLLSDSLRQALSRPPDVGATVAAATQLLAARAGELASLEAAYAEDGLRGFEDGLMRGYLTHVAAGRMHPVIRAFFASFIDLRNVMILYKHLRWEIEGAAQFIPGGSLEASRLEQVAARGQLAGLDEFAQVVTGTTALPAAASEGALESVLLGSMTAQVREAGRWGGEVEVILDYLWRSYVQARNLALLKHAGDLGADALRRELIG
ncbi:MAG: V-type ATPase subunit [Steroidobacteraceae bacterium]